MKPENLIPQISICGLNKFLLLYKCIFTALTVSFNKKFLHNLTVVFIIPFDLNETLQVLEKATFE